MLYLDDDQFFIEVRFRIEEVLMMLQKRKGVDYYSKFVDAVATYDCQLPKISVHRRVYEKISTTRNWSASESMSLDVIEFHELNLSYLACLPKYLEEKFVKFESWIEDAKLIELFRNKEQSGAFDQLSVSSAKGIKFQIRDRELIDQLFSSSNLKGRYEIINFALESHSEVMKKFFLNDLSETSRFQEGRSSTIVTDMFGTTAKRRDSLINFIALYLEIYDLVDLSKNGKAIRSHQVEIISSLLQASGVLSQDDYESPLEQIVRNALNRDSGILP